MGLDSVHILSREMHTYTYILYIVIHLIEKKRNGAYDIWSDMGIGIPHKVYLGSTTSLKSMNTIANRYNWDWIDSFRHTIIKYHKP